MLVQMSREAEKRGFSTPDREQEIDGHEQAVDGGEWSAAETSVAAGMREWVYATTASNCMFLFIL